MTTPRNTGPGIPARRIDERAYERALRVAILDPMLADTLTRINQAGDNYYAIRQAIQGIPADPRLAELTAVEADALMQRVKLWHTERFRKQMRRYFGVRVDLLRDTPLDLQARVRENVSLVRTIPERFHDSLEKRIAGIQADAPFDRQRLNTMLRREYKSSGYNLRRLTRDQTSKLTGALNEARQTEVGVARYQWQTSEDERVRPTHQDNNGQVFAWASPPPETGHPGTDVQCRCVALPVVQ